MTNQPKNVKWITYTSLFLILLGISLRTYAILEKQDLEYDEAANALVVTNLAVKKYVKGTGDNVGLPIGQLLAWRFLLLCVGPTDTIHRLIPYFFSLLSLLIFARLAKQWLPLSGALIALGLFAINPELVSRAGEAKHYAVDVLVAVIIYGLFAWVELRGQHWKRNVVFGLVTGLCLWFSYAGLFTLVSVTLVRFVALWKRRRFRELRCWLVAALLWGSSFYLLYALILSNKSSVAYSLHYWKQHFLPLESFPHTIDWLYSHFLLLFNETVNFLPYYVVAALFVVGTVRLCKDGRLRFLALLLGPILLALGASALWKYPFFERALLFSMPGILILVALGLAYLLERSRMMGVVFCLVIILPTSYQMGVRWKQVIASRQGVKEVVYEMKDHMRRRDSVYVMVKLFTPYRYYFWQNSAPWSGWLWGEEDFKKLPWASYPNHYFFKGFQWDMRKMFSQLKRVRKGMKNRRLWVVLHKERAMRSGYFALLDTLDKYGKRLHHINSSQAEAFLFEFPPEIFRHSISRL